MKLEYIPLLQVQRDLYAMPRGFERFSEYIRTMVDPDTGDLKLPLVAMNPMGKDHIPALLDRYLAFAADEVAAQTVREAEARLANIPGEFKVTLVISDDAIGGWTNRYFAEFSHRFGSKPYFRRGWLAGIVWTSEAPDPEMVRLEILTLIYRAAHIVEHGFAITLRDMIQQEGDAMAQAGCKQPALDSDDLVYTGEVISPYLASKEQPTQMAALYGDEVAKSLGYAPLGLSPHAGLAWALAQRRKGEIDGKAQVGSA